MATRLQSVLMVLAQSPAHAELALVETKFRALCDRTAGIDLRCDLEAAAVYALKNPCELAFSSVAAVAEQAGVSATTFTRLGKAMGLRGYKDLQQLFRQALRPEENGAVRH